MSPPTKTEAAPIGASRWRALLIGIDRYRHVTDLAGAKSDVQRASRFLQIALGMPEANIATLTDEQATRAAMLDALMALGDADLQADDQVLVHYSGHGAHMRDPRTAEGHSPSGFIESLVAHDSGRDGEWNIPDYIVGALLDRIARKAHLTVVLDCCHSGSGTRKPDALTRTIDPDARKPPPDLDSGVIAALGGPGRAFADEDMRYTALAACSDRERALEHSERIDGEPRSSGLFSWCLYRTLGRTPPGSSYGMLMEQVSTEVTARSRWQHPQCAGRRDRVVFGGVDVRVDTFVTVCGAAGDQVVLDAGTIQGLAVGATLALYPADIRTRAQLAPSDAHPEGIPPIAFATVTRAGPTSSRARLDSAGSVPLAEPDALLHARAVPLHPPTDGGQVQFTVEPGAEDLGELLGGGAGGGPRVTKPGDEDAGPEWAPAHPDDLPDVEVVVRRETVELRTGAGALIARPQPRGPWVWPALTKISRADRLARLHNPDPGSQLQGRIELRVRRHVDDADPRASTVVTPNGGQVVLPYDPLAADAMFTVEAINHSPIRAQAQLILLNADYSIMPLYPTVSDRQQIDPGRSLFAGHRAPGERIEAWLPGDEPDAPDQVLWTRSQNLLLCIASQAKVDVTIFAQDPLRGALPGTRWRGTALEALLFDCARGKRLLRRKVSEDWGVTRVPVDVVRRPRRVALWAGRPQMLPIGVELKAEGLSGQVSAAALDRHQVFEAVDRPPLEEMRAAGWLPVPSPALGAGDAPLVLRLEGRAEAGATIVLTMPEADGPLVPLAFDQRRFTIIGRSDDGGRIHIELPAGPLDHSILFARAV